MSPHAPAIFSRRNDAEETAFQSYCATAGITLYVDEYEEAHVELVNLANPNLIFTKPLPVPHGKEEGVWVCFPWKHTAVHTLEKKDYHAVRLSRNHDLITQEEQALLSEKRVAFAGLNVGNPAAVCMVQEGVGGTFAFADNDILGLSNLNRFRAGLCEVGLNKAVLSAHQAYEIDPFVDIDLYPNGITPENLEEFLEGADLFVEEMDNLPLKIITREQAKAKKIPTIMVTGNGGGCVLDIERYDLEPELEILSGELPAATREAILSGGSITPQEKMRLARDFMGEGTLTERLFLSFDKVGKTLIGIPQLSEASFLRGAVLTSVARSILLGDKVPSGRYSIQLSDIWKN